MAYDAIYLAQLDLAILKLATGVRIVQLTMGDKMISYGPANLTDLRLHRAEVADAVEAEAGSKPRFILTSTSKGL